ncbi:hypothetical protein LCGC14_3011730, partial [marine sediment metagenome]
EGEAMRQFTEIQGLSEIKRLPRLGKIRLGIRVKKKAKDDRCKHGAEDTCMYCTYPKETSYFVVPDEVAKARDKDKNNKIIYGKQPTELDVMLPVNDLAIVFPQALEYYGMGAGLKCTGNGKTALRMNEDTRIMERRECPCEYLDQGKCTKRGHLAVILFNVSMGGIYQIDTSSFNSIVDINSSLAYIEGMIGRFAKVALKLKRNPIETHHDGKRQTHYTMRIELEGDVAFVNKLRKEKKNILSGPRIQLQAPVQDVSSYDGETAVEDGNGEPTVAELAAEPEAPPVDPQKH